MTTRFRAAMGACAVAAGGAPAGAADILPIFDAHLHHSHDAWESVPPQEAIAILRQAGLKRAPVSSSNDDGTQRLFAAAPDLVVPALRPCRTRGEIGTWMRDETVLTYVEERLKKYRYAAIGEFHAYGHPERSEDLPRMARRASFSGDPRCARSA